MDNVRIEDPRCFIFWEFCADADFNTPYQTNVEVFTLGPGRYAWIEDYLGPGSNDSISSFHRVDGWVV